jgi:hypothetical protein
LANLCIQLLWRSWFILHPIIFSEGLKTHSVQEPCDSFLSLEGNFHTLIDWELCTGHWGYKSLISHMSLNTHSPPSLLPSPSPSLCRRFLWSEQCVSCKETWATHGAQL